MNRTLAGIVAFLTSAAVLIMEIVASRLLAPYVGVTLQTYTAIIGVVLAGISLGAWLGGRLADRGKPVRHVSLVLIIGGGLVFASLFCLRLAAKQFDGYGPSTAVMLVVSAFLAPATVLSMVTPLLVKASLQDLSRTGREVGRISSLGTAGAIVGTFVAGFLLVATIPSPTIMLIVGAILVLMGAGLWFLTRKTHGPDSSARIPLAMIVAAGGLGGTVPLHKTPCEIETAYFCATVFEDGPNIRTLQLDTLMHSAVNLADDKDLLFEYTQSIGAVIDASWPQGQAINAIHVGGGGFTMPRYVRATRPGSTNLVIERDPELVKLDRRELGLVTDAALQVRSVDGRIALRSIRKGSADLLVGDAFGGEAVPWHLTTKEFTTQIRDVLKPNGIYALNIIDGAPAKFAKAEMATLLAVFDHVALVAPSEAVTGQSGANYIAIASMKPLPVLALRAKHQEMLFPNTVYEAGFLKSWVGNARVLTDAFAPVDQLLTSEG